MGNQCLSIALCTYNGTNYLQEQLDSIAAQTRLPDELVICDDRSSDNTVDIIKLFASKVAFPVHLYINEKNLKTIKNFEKAISLCRGDVIVLSDQDDVWKPYKVESILTAFREHPGSGYVFSNAELVDENLRSLGSSLWKSQGIEDSVIKEYNPGEQVRILLKKNLVWGVTMAFRSSLKELILPISQSFFMHDAWIALLASCAGFYGVPLSDSLVYYRQHTTQQVGSKDNTLIDKLKAAKNPEYDTYKIIEQGLLDAKSRLLLMKPSISRNISIELSLIQQQAKHFSNRALIGSSSNFPLKMKALMSDTLRGKYHYYSNSWISIVKDLVTAGITSR